ncbi:hypothetical protein BU24DRAFT_248896 [Aaosphaeria arxii CBS 175.79]|uniref:SUZ domain-containing protein n=1 Tax=Aaosphaeria arxii CBS 175.79 TaxID=1450172 RepID=A0A6A5XKR7_9PLEO|nr:uncharacterized protein BU24DRAFT_248896 [Aaosphaeria arxii CBS 175.79]KAF2013865.1 hypothetical protein BU24DRAFT_248896 [Aaosphaeria arxii CBS 175.79]
MASTTTIPYEPQKAKPSFAKVAASSYKPHTPKENIPMTTAPVVASSPPIVSSQTPANASPDSANPPITRTEKEQVNTIANKSAGVVSRNGHWEKGPKQQGPSQPGSKDDEVEKPRAPIIVGKSLATEDNSTQLSSSDGSAKPSSLDGKSVASTTTFAMDEKESLRPDDSASLRAVEEEDITSPPDSVAAGSRVGSDSGVARAFRDQLHEIAVMGPLPQRGAPPGRFPNLNANGTHSLYDPTQSQNGGNRPISQPLGNGMPNVAGTHSVQATPDEKLIEALESPRDRLFVLKLEQDFIDFVKDSRENELSLPNCNTFYRMLAHRLADYYLLGHVVDNTMTGVKITRTPYCRIPPPLSGLPVSSKNTSTPPVDLPARKIMRREDGAKSGTNTTANSEGPSKTTSEVGGGSGSEGDNNEANGTESKDKSTMTREEREARYREARERIFGSVENAESDANDAASGEEKDASRSSSASGKKKSKKQRSYDDDFEARSRYNAYYPPYQVSGFENDQSMYYPGYPGGMQNQQYNGMNAATSPPPNFNSGYPVMVPQEAQNSYGWQGQQYPQANGPMNYSNYGSNQNVYDLSNDFQRGMQSFQSAGMPSQVTPKMSTAPMAPYQDNFQQAMPMNPGWTQPNQQPTYQMSQAPFTPNGPSGNRPLSAPMQGHPNHYAYGQYPPSAYNGKPNRNQHPLPGSFNRQQFNPQSQAFIPGGRSVPYQMQQNMPGMMNQGMNNFGNYQMPPANQMPGPMSGPSPPSVHQQAFGSPMSTHNIVPAPMNNSSGAGQAPYMVNSQNAMMATPTFSQPTLAQVPTQSSIAKWGTPSHLPPKPPAPAQPQPPKFNLPGQSAFPTGPRLPTNI